MELKHKDILFPDVPHDGIVGVRLLKHHPATQWGELWDIYRTEWEETARKYENNPGDFHHAWHYLDGHPALWFFRPGTAETPRLPLAQRIHARYLTPTGGINRCISIDVVKVNPETRNTDDEPATETEIWIEIRFQPWPVEYNPRDPGSYDHPYRDYLLDTGGPTVETAILRAAYNVWTAYGNDRRACDSPRNDINYKLVVDDAFFEGLMREHGNDGKSATSLEETSNEHDIDER